MKAKIIGIIACGFLVAGLAGCSGNSNSNDNQQHMKSTSTPQTLSLQSGHNNPNASHESNEKVNLSKHMIKCSLKDAATDGSLDAQRHKPMLKSYSKANDCKESTALLDTNYRKAYEDAIHHMHLHANS